MAGNTQRNSLEVKNDPILHFFDIHALLPPGHRDCTNHHNIDANTNPTADHFEITPRRERPFASCRDKRRQTLVADYAVDGHVYARDCPGLFYLASKKRLSPTKGYPSNRILLGVTDSSLSLPPTPR